MSVAKSILTYQILAKIRAKGRTKPLPMGEGDLKTMRRLIEERNREYEQRQRFKRA